ncbi:ferric reductase NAD binding domain-containing protein [Ilyonectria destructans]|nr:ferric reductase NAD binding domain-containing protein [Ilyonectria destructans]
MQLFAARAKRDHEAMMYYAAALAGIMGLFIISHFVRLLVQRTRLQLGLFALSAPFLNVARLFRRTLLSKMRGLPSVGHGVLATVYLALNIAFIFVNVDSSILSLHYIVGARTGWLSIANICFTVFLALKNTPLAYLTAWSYDRLNSLHQIAGWTTLALVVVHGATYSSFFLQQNDFARLRVTTDIYGITAGFTMLSIAVVTVSLRRWYYELFYLLHIFFFVVSLVFIGLHHPTVTERVVIAVGVAAGMWLLDRLVRLIRLCLYSINNTAAVFPLPNGGTRVVLKKSIGAKPGEHSFLWIPKIRTFETHPFTITSVAPFEFVVASYDGFTRDLHEHAVQNPGAVLRASVEGPYGKIPDPEQYDNVVLIAGGSGASFAFGVAQRLLERPDTGLKRHITLIWIMKNSAYLDWFLVQLGALLRAADFSVSLYITNQSGLVNPSKDNQMVSTSSDIIVPPGYGPVVEKSRSGSLNLNSKPFEERSEGDGNTQDFPITYGRPDIHALIVDAVNRTPANQRILIMGCGPDKLMKKVRNSTTSCMRLNGPSIGLHCEQFGW